MRLRIGAGHRGLRARMRENNLRTEAAIAALNAFGLLITGTGAAAVGLITGLAL